MLVSVEGAISVAACLGEAATQLLDGKSLIGSVVRHGLRLCKLGACGVELLLADGSLGSFQGMPDLRAGRGFLRRGGGVRQRHGEQGHDPSRCDGAE